MKVPNYKPKTPLFNERPWRDWAMWLGSTLGAFSTYSSLRSYFSPGTPNFTYMSLAEVLALLIDAGFSFGVSFAIFGVLPAVLRRRAERRELVLLPQQSKNPASARSLMLMPVVAVLVAIGASEISARRLYPDTSIADNARASELAFNRLSPDQVAALEEIQLLPSEWNEVAQEWVNLYLSPELDPQKFGAESQPLLAQLGESIRNAESNQRLLAGTDAASLFDAVVKHYRAKLDAVSMLTSATTKGDVVAISGYEKEMGRLTDLNVAVVCSTFRALVSSPYSGVLTIDERQRVSEQLAQC